MYKQNIWFLLTKNNNATIEKVCEIIFNEFFNAGKNICYYCTGYPICCSSNVLRIIGCHLPSMFS